ncbi:DUF2332 domain-containing protein [Prosthecomicrobium sp. N25]|uniref:DUF2332 domain-containing protein n=1 Tax=Prosthecomicrobium sp. N25 TaxID=3129254 RepID=UPI0030784641
MSEALRHQALAERYARFAQDEVHGNSPLYEMICYCVARSDPVLDFIATLPRERQQPNLFLAALRQVAGVPRDQDALEAAVSAHSESIADLMRSRTTQTNECGRCAVLLPLLAQLRQPIAIIEVGAAAGLCLVPDLYGYDYGRVIIEAPEACRSIAPVLRCDASPSTPLPTGLPSIVWRAGLDIKPLDVWSAEDMAWLKTLVWPEQIERQARLDAAIEVAKSNLIRIERGDLASDLPRLAAAAPPGVPLIVFHTAVLAYVPDLVVREAFARTVRDLGAIWISNEMPEVFPTIAQKVAVQKPGRFLLAVNGEPKAWTAPHGQWMEWLR